MSGFWFSLQLSCLGSGSVYSYHVWVLVQSTVTMSLSRNKSRTFFVQTNPLFVLAVVCCCVYRPKLSSSDWRHISVLLYKV